MTFPKGRLRFFLVLCMCLSPLAQVKSIPEETVPEITLEFRALQPGEIIKVHIEDRGEIARAYMRFNGNQYRIPFGRPVYSDGFLAFVGLDLSLRAGEYPLDITIQFLDGNFTKIRKNLRVIPKEFPEKKLWVDEKYVIPPESVRERIRRESDILATLFNIYSPQWLGRGPFIIPVEGKESRNFGERRTFNNQPRSPHSGTDISAATGTEVKAANTGTVVLASSLYYSGKTVVIDHGLGVFSFYCHFSRIRVKRGAGVEKGDVIGEVGATGRVTGPHLHWSIRLKNSRVDPYSLLYINF